MKFSKINSKILHDFSSNLNYEKAFKEFIKDYNVKSVAWGKPNGLSANYLLRLLQDGLSRAGKEDENSHEIVDYQTEIFDHCALWKTNVGKVFCTVIPYGNADEVIEKFERFKMKYGYPHNIKITTLDNKYKYRINGDFMLLIYEDSEDKFV